MKNKNNKEIDKPKLEDYINHDKLRELCRRYEKELSVTRDYMFWFLLIWTIALLAIEWLNFFNILKEISEAMAAGYIVLLGAYIVHKEVSRWADIKTEIRKGELFVYIWWGSFLAMFLITIFREEFAPPYNMPMLSYEVLGYFIFSEVSKSINRWRKHQRHNNRVKS